MTDKTRDCCLCVCVFLNCIVLIFVGFAIFEIIDHGATNTECHVKNINYPTMLPNETNTENWIKCDCGKRCWAWYPTVTLFLEVEGNEGIYQGVKDKHSSKKYTFGKTDCRSGENVVYTQQYLRDAIELAESYKNKTIDCYFDNSYAYLSYDLDLVIIIFIFVLCFMCCVGFACFCYHSREPSPKHYEV